MNTCKIGIHKYKYLGTQTVHNVIVGWAGAPLMRGVKMCKCCGKIKYIRLDISSNAHLDNSLNWKPNLLQLQKK